jgi:hypothetical protein
MMAKCCLHPMAERVTATRAHETHSFLPHNILATLSNDFGKSRSMKNVSEKNPDCILQSGFWWGGFKIASLILQSPCP